MVPDWGLAENTEKAFTEVLKRIAVKKKPTVIDADGLKLLSKNKSAIKGMNVILTPHLGEFKTLTGSGISSTDELDEVLDTALGETRKLGATVLLKVSNGLAVITDGQKHKVNFTGNTGMAKGGVGDVLSGIAATFLSWTQSPFEAAAAAAFVCGKAGDIAYSKVADSLTPILIIENIYEAMKPFFSGRRKE